MTQFRRSASDFSSNLNIFHRTGPYRSAANYNYINAFGQVSIHSQEPLANHEQQGQEQQQTSLLQSENSRGFSDQSVLVSGRLGPLNEGAVYGGRLTTPINFLTGYIQQHLQWFRVGKVFKAPHVEYANMEAVSAALSRNDHSVSSFTTSAYEGTPNFHEICHYIIVCVKRFHSLCL